MKRIFIFLFVIITSCEQQSQDISIINEWEDQRGTRSTGDYIDTFKVLKMQIDSIQNYSEHVNFYCNIEELVKNKFKMLVSGDKLVFEKFTLSNVGKYDKSDSDVVMLIEVKYNSLSMEDYYIYSQKYGIISRLYYHGPCLYLKKRYRRIGNNIDTLYFDKYIDEIVRLSGFWMFSQ
ncbi:MAG: hypothetical protein IPM69_04655 [Ignavibacteria bacterium]|jgi:hypothetical protein|nr:hypothetical protein [Ignavibacteria bacterium]